MSLEHVTRGLTFDNLYVEVSVYRYICRDCGRRECFHDVPTPYGEVVPTPQSQGWRLVTPIDDGEQDCLCPKCCDDERKALEAKGYVSRIHPEPKPDLANSSTTQGKGG